MRASSRADTDKPEVKLRTSKRTSEILSPRTKSRREKVRHSLKIIQAHKQRYLKELEQCKDPILALLLTAVFEENVYQQTITDLTRVCIILLKSLNFFIKFIIFRSFKIHCVLKVCGNQKYQMMKLILFFQMLMIFKEFI